MGWRSFLESLIDVLDFYGDTTYQMLPEFPSTIQLQRASEYQLFEFSERSLQHSQIAHNEYTRRQTLRIKPIEADIKLMCLKMLVGTFPSLHLLWIQPCVTRNK